MTGQDGGHIGSRIRAARIERGMSQTQLAAALSVRERTIARWEAEAHQPDTRYLRDLARELDCSVLWLLDGTNGNGPEEAAA